MNLLNKRYREILQFTDVVRVSNFELYDPRVTSSEGAKQYPYKDGENSMNNQSNGCNGDKRKERWEKEIKQYREYRERKRSSNKDEMVSNGRRIRGVSSPILPMRLRDEMEKRKRVDGSVKEDISPLV